MCTITMTMYAIDIETYASASSWHCLSHGGRVSSGWRSPNSSSVADTFSVSSDARGLSEGSTVALSLAEARPPAGAGKLMPTGPGKPEDAAGRLTPTGGSRPAPSNPVGILVGDP